MDWRLSSGDTGPHVHLTTPPSFSFGWPLTLPHALPPPINERSFRSPFGINKDLFNAALHPAVPITTAIVYVVSVLYLNSYNARRDHKPWAISRWPLFKRFVVAHNALLTIFSIATFAAMLRAAIQVWPAADSNTGLAGVADAFCKIHGPRGLGDATTYNATINIWEAKNTAIKLGYDGNPDPTDVGRLWNEGLAFWGWMFYVSKFYEVVDTLIILAKGKRSATLQTYHHSGAMLCMWAGIRYMSPPIWMFVFVNSFIHGLMYTYFTMTAIGMRVPTTLKRLLTTLQIAQFVWGASYAAAHLFIKYDIPVSTPYQVASVVKAAVSSVSSAASAASSTASQVVHSPAASGTLLALAKKLVLRAIGEEGIAEHVTNNQGEPLNDVIQEQIQAFNERTEPSYETKWRTELTRVNCIDTSGEAFAIYLNLFYLAPLTFLFGRFFIRAYTNYGKPRNVKQAAKQTRDSGKEAKIKTEEKVEQTGRKAEAKLSKLDAEVRKDLKALKEGTLKDVRSASQKANEVSEKTQDKAKDFSQKAQKKAGEVSKKTQEKAGEVSQKTQEKAGEVSKKTQEKAGEVSQKTQEKAGEVSKKTQEKAGEVSQKTQAKAEDFSQKAQKKVDDLSENINNPSNSSGHGSPQKSPEQTKAHAIKSETEVSNESAEQLDKVLADSQAARPGVKAEDGPNVNALTSSYASTTESATTQDNIMQASQNIRPGVKAEDSMGESRESIVSGEEDTDAMGKSGAIVDFTAEKAYELAIKAEDAKEEVKQALQESS